MYLQTQTREITHQAKTKYHCDSCNPGELTPRRTTNWQQLFPAGQQACLAAAQQACKQTHDKPNQKQLRRQQGKPKLQTGCLLDSCTNTSHRICWCGCRYHPECLKTSRKALAAQANWRCPECAQHPQEQSAAAAAAKPGDKRSRSDADIE